MRLIDVDDLNNRMYHEAFETDSPMQKWDSGCWIRYKMFEKHLAAVPTVDAAPVVHGKWHKVHNPNYSPFDGSAEHLSSCSVCGYLREQYDFRYCPNCGARMDGKAE